MLPPVQPATGSVLIRSPSLRHVIDNREKSCAVARCGTSMHCTPTAHECALSRDPSIHRIRFSATHALLDADPRGEPRVIVHQVVEQKIAFHRLPQTGWRDSRQLIDQPVDRQRCVQIGKDRRDGLRRRTATLRCVDHRQRSHQRAGIAARLGHRVRHASPGPTLQLIVAAGASGTAHQCEARRRQQRDAVCKVLRQRADIECIATMPQQPPRRAARELGQLQQHVEPRLAVDPFERLDTPKRLPNAEAAGRRVVRAHDVVRFSTDGIGEVHQRRNAQVMHHVVGDDRGDDFPVQPMLARGYCMPFADHRRKFLEHRFRNHRVGVNRRADQPFLYVRLRIGQQHRQFGARQHLRAPSARRPTARLPASGRAAAPSPSAR